MSSDSIFGLFFITYSIAIRAIVKPINASTILAFASIRPIVEPIRLRL